MSRSISVRVLTAICAVTLATAALADTVIVRNVRGYTPQGQGISQFSGMIIVDGRVQQLLTAEPNASALKGATVIDGGGKTTLPGLIDAHGHVLGLGQERIQANLRGSPSLQDVLARTKAFSAANPRNPWVLGSGWNQTLWTGKQFPTAKDLDAAISDRPASLSRIDGHAVWVNSRALQIAGITRDTPDPQGGQIVRDSRGEATGVLVDAASSLVERHIPPLTDADVKRALTAAMNELASLGLTGVHDAGIDQRQYQLYQQLGAAGELPVRVYAMLADSKEARDIIAAGPKASQFDDHLQMSAVKSWIDGALGSRGAAMRSDYSDQPHHRGLMLYTPEELRSLAQLTASKGWQLNVHAIGDDGNHLVLDTFESMFTPAQRKALRPRIEHAQVLSLEDIPRFAQLGVIASMQPTHATSDMNMAEDRVGAERIKGAYAWRSLLNAGARLAGGSDFPVELPNPFLGLYAAVTRQDREGHPPGGWYPQQKLTREEALRLFTIDAAYAARMETSVGSLEPGKWADFILIDRDYFKVPAGEIDDIKVLATYIAGRKFAATPGVPSP